MNAYNKWFDHVDRLCLADLGQSINNFDDYNWFDEYDNDVSAEDAYDEWKIHTECGTRSPGL